jgi:FkbH-like protein
MPAPGTPVEIALRLEPLTYDDKLVAASEILERMGRFSAPSCDALLTALQPANPSERDRRRSWLSASPPSPSVHYLQAAAASAERDPEAAAAAWSRFFSAAPCDDPFVFLEHARTLAGLSRWERAAAQLRRALELHPPYTFFPRAQRLLDRLWREAPPSARQARIAVLGSSTTSLMVPVLRALAFRDGIDAQFYEGMHGAFRQEALLPDSGISRFKPDIVVIATHYRDLNLPPVVEDEESTVGGLTREYRALWQTLADRFGCHIVQHGFDCPPHESYGSLASRLPGGRTRITRLVNLRLEAEAPSFVSVLDAERVLAGVGTAAWHQSGLWQVAQQHPGTDALPALCEEQIAHIRAVLGLTRKVLVCDLDNTLWGGVIGEDGLDGIRIGTGSPEGECYADLQRYIRELKDRGVLLAVCSKNNPADARSPFEKHDRMVLRLDDFVAFVANWDDKVTNLRRIAEMLRLGLDSFVVLDDNPLERGWIRQELPQVAVVELGATPSTYVRALDRGRHFASLTWSDEDRARTNQYRRNAAVESARVDSGSLDAFLQGLNMRGTCRPIGPENLARVVQLTNKTNQFNLTTKRYTEAQIERLRAMPDAWSGVFTLVDGYGDHGIIGLLIAVPADTPATWEIDTWLMSCRVLGRRFEEFMADRLIEAARQRGVSRIVGVYRPTEKNSLVADLYPRLGFAADGVNGRFTLDVASVTRPLGEFIEHAQLAAAP